MPDNRLTRYIREASRLRHAITLNEADYNFATNAGNKIHYILDTNVVAMFMDPASNANFLGPFSYWLDDDTRAATATLTAEYLLSNALPGHDEAEPSVMAPDHFEEVINLAAKATREIDRLSDDEFREAEQELKKRRLEVQTFSAELSRSEDNYSQKVDLLKRQMPSLIQHLVDGPLAEIIQLRRALAGNNLSRIDAQSWFHLTERHSHSLEVQWLQRIMLAARSGEHGRTRIEKQPYNFIADARALSLITELIREFSKDGSHRFLFVTADKTLLQATEEFIRSEIETDEALPSPSNVFVRHPREFLPLLNLSTINNDENFRPVFEKVKGVLDLLLTGIGPVTSQGNVYQEPTAEELESSLANQGSSSDIVDELEKLWGSASRTAIASSVGILRGRDEDMFEAVANFIQSEDIKRDVQEKILDDLDRLIRDHSGLTIQGVFEAVERQIQRQRDDGFRLDDAILRVTPHLIDKSIFTDLLPEGDFEEMLRDASRGADQSDLHQRLASKNADEIVCLLLACLCLAVGLWEAARDYAGKARVAARANSRSGQLLADINYIFVAASRIGLRSYDEFKSVERIIIDDIAALKGSSNRLLEQRAISELAALRIGVVEQAIIAEREHAGAGNIPVRLNDEERQKLVQNSAVALTGLRHVLDGFDDGQDGLDRLRVQVAVNSAALSILANVMRQPRLRQSLEVDDVNLLSDLEGFLKKRSSISPVTEPYWMALKAYQLNPDERETRNTVERLKEKAQERFLPRTDREWFTFLADELSNQA